MCSHGENTGTEKALFSLWVILISQMDDYREVCSRLDLEAGVLFYTDVYQHCESNSFMGRSTWMAVLSW